MPDLETKVALYYPTINFPGDAWVKLAALYWDKLGRIVPPNISNSDSDTVIKLRDEIGFIKNFSPERYAYDISSQFIQLLHEHEKELVQRYNVDAYPHKLGYIYSEYKMVKRLQLELLRSNLGKKKADNEHVLIELHPKLAEVYMEALAEQMAYEGHLNLITKNEDAHIAMGPYTMDRFAQALLSSDEDELHFTNFDRKSSEVEGMMATVAFQSVLPKNIAAVPVEKIVKFRKNYSTELAAFQNGVHDLVAELDTLQQISDTEMLKAHLEVAYEKKFKPQLNDLEKSMRSIGIETLAGILTVNHTIPTLLANGEALLALPPAVVGSVMIASCIVPVWVEKRNTLREKVQKSPASYLLYMQQELQPTTVVSRIAHSTRKVLFGI